MITLLTSGQYALFALLLIAIILSLSIHEFGHAWVAKLQGDRTAESQGRLTLNPLAHIDAMGLAMVVFVGFGYAKPVPTDPRNFTSRYSTLWVAAAGPGMNLVLAFVSINVLAYLMGQGDLSPGAQQFLYTLGVINLLLMLFNLMPIGPLDGHYMLPYFLPRPLAHRYVVWNERFGVWILIGLIVLAVAGVPIFSALLSWAGSILAWLVVV